MEIVKVEIANFRALKNISVPLKQFSVLLGENDVGKTSFLYSLERFFSCKKMSDPKDWFQHNTEPPIRITVTFSGLTESEALEPIKRTDDTVIVSRVFSYGTTPETKAILDDNSAVNVPAATAREYFSSERFHFIPVRRDLAVQFSMNKTALLGKLIRAAMKSAIRQTGAQASIEQLRLVLSQSIEEPRASMESFLKEQLSNETVRLGFDDMDIDPTEGVSFSVRLSDDRVESVDIGDRGAGTQNNLIIALFRLIAESTPGQLIFAMEEPENSLHPKAQRQLLSVIQEISSSNQVIVTTHSPVFIDRSRFESNVLLTRTAAGNTVAKVFDSSDLSEIRVDLGIRASDALLKGGGNCAVLVEGSTEEDGLPVFMEMIGLSEFELGIAIVNMGGSDFQKSKSIIQLLKGYDIPCVVILDLDAQATKEDLERMKGEHLSNLEHVHCWKKGTIEDYYPTSVVAQVINQEFSPATPVEAHELNGTWSGKERLENYKRIMFEHQAGSSLEYLKKALGGIGTRMLRAEGAQPDEEIQGVLQLIAAVARR